MKNTDTNDQVPITPDNPPQAQSIAPPPAAATGPYREDPGQMLGIIGLVLNIIGIAPGGIVLGILSRNKSREAGFPTVLGTVSMVWGIIATALGVLAFLFWIIMLIFMFASSDKNYSAPPSSPNEYDYSSSASI